MGGRGNFKNLTGQIFGKLTVLMEVATCKGKVQWRCKCECGNTKVTYTTYLTTGKTKSCGCLTNATHFHTVNSVHSATYSSWVNMVSRCKYPSSPAFEHYKKRGISVCKRWLTFANFLEDMGERPEGMTLDRFPDNDGNYKPGNCRWATKTEQANNRITNIRFDWKGKSYTLAELVIASGISKDILRTRLVRSPRKWTVEQAIKQGNIRLYRGDKRLPD